MPDLRKLLIKLIRYNNGRYRYVLAMVGLFFGFFLMLAAMQLQADYHELLFGKSNQDSVANFLVLNKALTNQNIGSATLSDADIQDLQKQPFVKAVGLLIPSRFKASIQSYSERFPFYTDIAFETVPDDFIDVAGKDWHWDESSPYVPIIVPNLFLDFYNFQFSFSQNLPQLTPDVVKMILFKVNLQGPNGNLTLNGKVVGFSNRISSLLVPENFMRWGNAHFSKNESAKPSSVIIKTVNPGSAELLHYLQKNQLVTDAEKTRYSRYRQIVDIVVSIAGLSGGILFVFALVIFTLFIQLTISSSKEEINLLLLLGVSPAKMRRFLLRQYFPINMLLVLFAIGIITLGQYLAHGILLKQNINLPILPAYTTYLGGALILFIVWVVTVFTIKSYLRLNKADESE